MITPLRLGSRGSKLALWQAHHVADQLRPLTHPRPVEIVVVQTAGDQQASAPLSVVGGQGAFTKEIQQVLLARAVDVAVHSLKDLPTESVPGLVLAAAPPRGPVGDVLVSRTGAPFAALPPGAVVATGSARRRAQAWRRRPDLQLIEVRGNVDTRLRKLREQGLDGLILARAGLQRLGLADVITESLDWMLPAVGQGALGLECRGDDQETYDLLLQLNDDATMACVTAERAFLRRLGGGCQLPIAALATCTDQELHLRGAVLDVRGTRQAAGEASGNVAAAATLGRQLAEELLDQGAQDLMGWPSGVR